MSHKFYLFFVLLLIVNVSVVGQNAGKKRVESRPVPSRNLKLDSLFSSFNNIKSPGVAISVIENGKVIAHKDYGMASIELQIPISHKSVVRIGYSEAREFIAIAAILMENDGLLSLNDKVRKYFPRLPEWSQSVTLWDLLNHRSGFVDEWSTLLLMHGAMSNRLDREQFLRLLYNQPEPQIEPGIGFLYCNSDFGLLRLIMEKASESNLSDWIRRRIFDTLKMTDTRMQKNALDIVQGRANKYEYYGNGFRNENVQKTSPGGNYFILTCADDLAKWSQAISDPRSEFNSAFEKLIQNGRKVPGKKNHYVTGHTLDTLNSVPVIFHEGVNGENYLTRIPSKGLTIITLGNLNAENFTEQKKFLINYLTNGKAMPFVKPAFAKTPIDLPEAELKRYEGKYRWLDQVSWQSNNEVRKLSDIYVENGILKARYQGNYIIDLVPVGKDLFYYEEGFGMQVRFNRPGDGSPMKLTVSFDDGFPGVSMEREDYQWKPVKEDLVKFTGRYYSRHLDYYWNLHLNEEGQVVLTRATMPDVILQPDGENQFHYIAEKGIDDGFDQWIRFEKDAASTIIGFTVWSSRVMHHRFVKN